MKQIYWLEYRLRGSRRWRRGSTDTITGNKKRIARMVSTASIRTAEIGVEYRVAVYELVGRYLVDRH